MSIQLNLRFQKNDRYGHPIFICSCKNIDENVGFNKLTNMSKKIDALNLKTFLPIYKTSDYATIRFSHKKSDFVIGNTYTVDFTVKKNSYNSKMYINCYVDKCELFKEGVPYDEGEIMTF